MSRRSESSDIDIDRLFFITVRCHEPGGGLIGECGTVAETAIGPTGQALHLRVPTGVELRAAPLGVLGEANPVVVPERILGVERYIWDCFSDRPGKFAYVAAGDRVGGCGGWAHEIIRKWDISKPVRVWADPAGHPLYIRLLDEALEELSPLLNLEFKWVEKESEADLRAYVGLSKTSLPDVCQDSGGCAWKDSVSDSVIEKATLIAWLGDGPEYEQADAVATIMHEAIHVLADMVHRKQLSSIMSNVGIGGLPPQMNRIDRDLLALYGHPMIEPGMSVAYVRELAVLADELLDPPIDPYEILRGVPKRLRTSSATRFKLKASWSCATPPLGPGSYQLDWGTYEISHTQDVMRFVNEDTDVSQLPDTGWPIWTGNYNKDRTIEGLGLGHYADPRGMVSVHFRTYREDIEIEELAGGDIRMRAILDNGVGTVSEITAVITAETFEIRSYDMIWNDMNNTCMYEVEAKDGQYDVDLNLGGA